jgi:histone-arginine methyltransferase CARM1
MINLLLLLLLLLLRLQVVVDAFDPSVLVSDCATHVLDFATAKEEELYDISIPLNLTVGEGSQQLNCFEQVMI